MAGLTKSEFKNPVVNWIDTRLPLFTMMSKEYATFPTPKNFNYFWNFGALATVTLLIMIGTGVFLAMHYTPDASMAFESVERIMRDVNYGWLLRYVHITAPRCSSSSSTSTSSAASTTAPTRRRASCCGCSAWSSCC